MRKQMMRELGASGAWLLALPASALLDDVRKLSKYAQCVSPLIGMPIRCADLRALGEEARERGFALVVDDSLPGAGGCAAVRLGAHVAYVAFEGDLCLVATSRDAERSLPGLTERLDALPQATQEQAASAACLAEEQSRLWQARSDAAQVVASYLRCHPLVAELRYPGLKGDPSFAVAARTLQRGFGPFVDWRAQGSVEWNRVECSDADPRAQVLALERALSA